MTTELVKAGGALAERPAPPVVTLEQLDLVKKAIAPDATDPELRLFLFDCQRRGVHPLDKLIHFTKRKGRYTPVVSIDLMRSRAAATGLHAGTDDAVYSGPPGEAGFTATVTVYRLVLGERFAFSATARFEEYVPEAGSSGNGDLMWRKMPHTMLGKCAEALALRKGFPQELAGLYTSEELDAPAPSATSTRQTPTVRRISEQTAAAKASDLESDRATVRNVENKGKFWVVTLSTGQEYTTKDGEHASELQRLVGSDRVVRVTYRTNEYQGRTYRNICGWTFADDASDSGGASPR